MTRVAGSLLVWLIACAPDYAHTAFVCALDADCPAGQRCLEGRCRRGEARGNGIQCGATTCAATAQCCVDGVNPPRCIRAGDRCFGQGALCDDKGDCAPDKCCADDSILSCNSSCAVVACQTDDDCPEGRPNCCHGDPGVPWGTCGLLPC